MRYAIFQVPEPFPEGVHVTQMHFGEGSALECVKLLLRQCSLTELQALKVHGIHEAQKVVAQRTAGECERRVAEELAGEVLLPAAPGELSAFDAATMDDLVGLTDKAPPAGVRDEDDDEDDDEADTAIELVDPASGVKEAWEEDHDGTAS